MAAAVFLQNVFAQEEYSANHRASLCCPALIIVPCVLVPVVVLLNRLVVLGRSLEAH